MGVKIFLIPIFFSPLKSSFRPYPLFFTKSLRQFGKKGCVGFEDWRLERKGHCFHHASDPYGVYPFWRSEEIPHFFAKNGEFTPFTFEHNSGTVEMVLIFVDTHGESPWHSFQNTSYA